VCVAVCCSDMVRREMVVCVLHCVVGCCSVLQRVASWFLKWCFYCGVCVVQLRVFCAVACVLRGCACVALLFRGNTPQHIATHTLQHTATHTPQNTATHCKACVLFGYVFRLRSVWCGVVLCCSVLQCVAVCCRLRLLFAQNVVGCCSVLQCVAVCCLATSFVCAVCGRVG